MSWLLRSKLLTLTVLVLLIWGVERLIVTDKEAIETLSERMSDDIGARRWDDLTSRLHPDFRYRHMDREAAVAHVRTLVDRHKPTGVAVRLFEIEVTEDTATAKGHVWGNVGGRPTRVGIDAKLTRTDEGWLLREVTGGYPGR